MGLYDTLKCEYELSIPATDFQTKSLDSGMGSYLITKSGELFLTWDFKGKVDPPERVDFTGAITFYTSHVGPHEWLEYTALFGVGQLMGIVRRVPTEEDNDDKE